MKHSTICNQCLRELRKSLRVGNIRSLHRLSSPIQQVRAFSIRSPLLEQPSSDSRPATPPITTSTVTANVTAAPPKTTEPSPSTSLPSTSQMQREITSRLSGRPNMAASLAQTLRRTASKTTETYITYGVTESLFKSCSSQADYTIPEAQRPGILTGSGPPKTAGGEDLGNPVSTDTLSVWFNELGLPATFSTWSQVAYLHMYLLTVRLRALDSTADFQNYQRYLLEHFSNAAEDKMVILHSMSARSIRNRYLKDLFLQWRGLLAAYDEGMINGDAVLAGAVWRNLWKGEEDVDWVKVAEVVAWMRRVVTALSNLEVGELAGNLTGKDGVFVTGWKDVKTSVDRKSLGSSEAL